VALGFLTLLLGGSQNSVMSFLVLFSGSARRSCEQNFLLAIFMARIRALDTETVRLYELMGWFLLWLAYSGKLFHCER